MELSTLIATTEGSSKTIPLPFTHINVLAVPRSIAISFVKKFFNISDHAVKYQFNKPSIIVGNN